jgi:hypothetical protein
VEAVPGVGQRIDVIHRRSLRRRQLGRLRVVEAAADVGARDLLHIISVDEAQPSPAFVAITIPSKTSTSGTSSTRSSVPIRVPALLSTGVPRATASYEIGESSVMRPSCLNTWQRGHLGRRT